MPSRFFSSIGAALSVAGLLSLPFLHVTGTDAQMPPSICTPADATLAAYWTMNSESAGATPDSTTYDNAGTMVSGAVIVASPTASTTFSNTGSLSLNTTGAYVLVNDVTGLPQGALPRSISVWMNQSATGSLDQATLVALGNGADANQKFILQMNTIGGLTYLFTDGVNPANNIVISGADIPPTDSWHHIVFTFDGANWAYYLDGTLRQSGTFAIPILTVNNAVEIGARHDNATGFFSGYLDDVRVYDRVLTPSEAASMAAGVCPMATGDLGITKSASGTVNRGSNVLYNLAVTNATADSATGVTVTDNIPFGVTYVPALSDAACSATGGVVTCPNLSVSSGATRNLALAFAVPYSYTCGVPLVNTATVSGSTLDPNPLNNSSTTVDTVNCVAPASTTLVVQPSNMQGWTFYTSGSGASGTGSFVFGPGVPPLGVGSAKFATGSDGDFLELRHAGYSERLLNTLSDLEYSTYVPTASGSSNNNTCQAPYLILTIDNSGDSDPDENGDNILFFEPCYQSGTVLRDTWQTWDAFQGQWYPGYMEDGSPRVSGPPTQTLQEYIATHPTAKIVNSSNGKGGVRIDAGGGGAITSDDIYYTDAFTIAFAATSTTYDFEPLGAPGTPGDLAILKSGSGTVNRGSNALYTLAVTNLALQSASGVTVRDTVPAGVTYVAAASDAACTQSGGVVTCANLVVGSGATRTLNLAFAVPASYVCTDPLVNTATVSGSTLDPNPANNSSTSVRTVNCLPGDLGITKSASGTTLNVGSNALYSVVVSNFGTTSATGVRVTDIVPAGVTYVPAASDAACTLSGSTVRCASISLGSGATRTYALAFAVPSSYNCATPLVNTATVSGSTLDPNSTNNTSTSTRTVTCPPPVPPASSSSVTTNNGGGGGGGGGGGRRGSSSVGVAPGGFGGGPTSSSSTGRTTFPDVVRGSFYEDAVRLFLERGFLDAGQTSFRPGDASTRAELTKLVIELHGGILHTPPAVASFDDVRNGTWYYDYFEDAGERTWVRGDSNCYGRHPCTARPNDGVLRAEAAAIIVRTFNFQSTNEAPRFSDVPQGTWYQSWVQTAADHCVLQGDSGRTTVRPLERVTRAELVTMLNRAYDNLSYEDGCQPQGTRSRINGVSLTSLDTLQVRFNTDIDEASASDEELFLLSCGAQRGIASTRRVSANTVEVSLEASLPAGRDCRISVMGLENDDGHAFFDTLLFTSQAPASSLSSRSSSNSSSSSRSSSSNSRIGLSSASNSSSSLSSSSSSF